MVSGETRSMAMLNGGRVVPSARKNTEEKLKPKAFIVTENGITYCTKLVLYP